MSVLQCFEYMYLYMYYFKKENFTLIHHTHFMASMMIPLRIGQSNR